MSPDPLKIRSPTWILLKIYRILKSKEIKCIDCKPEIKFGHTIYYQGTFTGIL